MELSEGTPQRPTAGRKKDGKRLVNFGVRTDREKPFRTGKERRKNGDAQDRRLTKNRRCLKPPEKKQKPPLRTKRRREEQLHERAPWNSTRTLEGAREAARRWAHSCKEIGRPICRRLTVERRESRSMCEGCAPKRKKEVKLAKLNAHKYT